MNTPSSPQVGDRTTPHRSCRPCPVLCLKVMAPRLLPGSSRVPKPRVWTAALPFHRAVVTVLAQRLRNMQPRQDPFQDCNPVCLGTVSGFQVLAPAFCWHTLSTGGEAIRGIGSPAHWTLRTPVPSCCYRGAVLGQCFMKSRLHHALFSVLSVPLERSLGNRLCSA